MRIRLRDAAALAGVSEATVSRVMNHKDGVSDRTRQRVVNVLAELGYEPPSLRSTARVGSVGLIVPELTNPVFPAFAQTIESLLIQQGYVSVLCCAIRTGASEEDYIETLLDRGVAGIIGVSGRHADIGADHEIYRALVGRAVPLVFVNGNASGLDVPVVSSDDRQAAVAAYEHLVALGHERIGLLVGPGCYVPVIRKIDGFRAAAAAAGVPDHRVERRVIETMFSVEGGETGAPRLLDAGVTGIVAGSDMIALGAIRAVRAAGLEVPDDVSVIGYDDTEVMRFTDPPLTTLRQPVTRLAEQSVELLLAQINQQAVPRRELLVECELIARKSTAGVRLSVGSATP